MLELCCHGGIFTSIFFPMLIIQWNKLSYDIYFSLVPVLPLLWKKEHICLNESKFSLIGYSETAYS